MTTSDGYALICERMTTTVERTGDERVSFLIEDDLLKAVLALAKKNERTLSGQIRLALREQVERENGAK